MTTTRTPQQEARYQEFLAEATEVIVEMNRRISAQGEKESSFCSAGCATCCHQNFHVHPVEFEVIYNRVANDPELRQRFDEQNARRQQLIGAQHETIQEISTINDDVEFILRWIKLKIPCALLYEGKCQVYDIRPNACSTYLTLSPPRVCAIDPKGYMSPPMAKLKHECGVAYDKLYLKHGIQGELLYDLSWHLDQRLNPPQDVKKEES